MRRANGEGTIIKLSGKRRKPYAVRITIGWTDEGKQIYKYLGYYSKNTDAKTALKEYNLNQYDLVTANVSFEELYKLWLDENREHFADNTLKIYNQSYKKCEEFHAVKFNALRKTHYQQLVNGASNSVGAKIKALLNHLYNYAIENDISKTNYAKNLKLAAENEIKVDRNIFTSEEIQTLWDNIETKYVDLVIMMLYTGVRIGEMLEIKTKNIDLENKIIIGGNKTTAGINRRIPIHDKIVPLVAANLDKSKEYLFTNRNGGAHNTDKFRERHFTKLMKQLDMKHTPHDTRHTFVTCADNVGMDERIKKLIIGHSTNDVTFDTYTHKTDAQLLDAVNMIRY